MEDSSVVKFFGKNKLNGNTIFHEIAIEGSLALLLRIRENLDEPIDLVLEELNDQGETCVHLAALMNRGQHAIEIIEVLRELGADLNARNRLGHTLMSYAIYNKDYQLIDWLLLQPEITLSSREDDEMYDSRDYFIDEKEETTMEFSVISETFMNFESSEDEVVPYWLSDFVQLR